jgi:hypothetical protein
VSGSGETPINNALRIINKPKMTTGKHLVDMILMSWVISMDDQEVLFGAIAKRRPLKQHPVPCFSPPCFFHDSTLRGGEKNTEAT